MVARRLTTVAALVLAGASVLCPAAVTLAYPIACFDYSYPTCPNDKYPVDFHDCSYDTETYSIVAWSWHFGDGHSSSQRNPSHQFSFGTYTVCLEVTNNRPLFPQHATQCKSIQVRHWNQPPDCDFYHQPINPDDETVVQFIDSSHDPDLGYPSGQIVSWYWDFGDGGSSTAQHPTHLFAAGTWQVELRVMDSGDCPYPMYDECSSTVTVIEANPPPDCCFSYTPAAPDDQTSVQFIDCSSDPNGSVAVWSWDFGDGGTSIEQNPSHLFAAGTYSVCLTVTDDWDPPESATCCQTVAVDHLNLPPTCAISYQPAGPTTGDTIIFDSGASDPDGEIVSVAWDFGDGGTAGGDPAGHQYAAAGTYAVSATVCDDQGACTTCQAVVAVAWQPPQCSFTHDPASPQVGESVQFVDGSADADGTVVAWSWEFGDGGMSADQHPTHTYISGGCFQAALTVTDSQGLSTTCSTCVPVRSDTEVPFCDAGWHLVAQPHSGDHALADITVRDDWNVLALAFCDATAAGWVQNPLFYYDTESEGYGQCGCAGLPPPTTEHTMRMGYGYWLYTFEPYLTLVFP